ncbi:MAG TPA: right-handed parallel beta-helix repeat-containing protein, partial [Anaerolineales bacterium]|nr:right-handed parallel beta-helix repeat-containing protein [Anaerolineales bacterium]
TAPETPAEAIVAANPRVFLPVVISHEAALPENLFFVAPSGSDSNPGTYSRPWRTIQKAANTLVAGQTVKILPGTYYAKFTPMNSGTAAAYITYTADPDTVVLDGAGVSLSDSAKGDGLVQIQGKSYIKVQNLNLRNSTQNCVNISESSSGAGRSGYVEVTGLNIWNCMEAGIRARFSDHILIKDNTINHVNYSSGIGLWWSNNVTVDHNTITNARIYHNCQGAHEEVLTIAGTNTFEVKNNTLDFTESNPPGYCSISDRLGITVKESSYNGGVYSNTIMHLNAAAIYLDAWHAGADGTPTLNHINIYRNKIRDSAGIIIGAEKSDGVVEYIDIFNNVLINTSFVGINIRKAYGDGLRKNINIYNNTIFGALREGGNGGAGIYVTTSHLASNNANKPIIIRNNISMFYFLSDGSGHFSQIAAGNSTIASMIAADHNLVSGPQNCSFEYPNCVEVGNRTIADPESVFSDPADYDLHLKNGSPAIDSGVSVSIVGSDFDDIPRSDDYDIGAYEFR